MTNTPTQSGPTRPQGAQSQGAQSQGAEFQGAGEAAALAAVDSLYAGTLPGADGTPTRTLYVSGAPRSGKTTFALEAFRRAHAVGNGSARMVVSGRIVADELGRSMISRLGVHDDSRVITTIPALAYKVLAQGRHSEGKTTPRLLNGAEQDELLSDVLAEHQKHAQAGELCHVCRLLLNYFDEQSAAKAAATSAPDEGLGSSEASQGRVAGTTEDVFARNITPEFVAQLRDVLARADEVGVGRNEADEGAVLDALVSEATEDAGVLRLRTQWQLAFALRHEYVDAINARYTKEFRVDSSYLLLRATQEVDSNPEGCARAIPDIVVVDDDQDLTLAGMGFLQSMERHGARLVLVGDPDESVQSFRGAYPEYLAVRIGTTPGSDVSGIGLADADLGRLNAHRCDLGHAMNGAELDEKSATYRDIVASRVSLHIASDEDGLPPLASRPWKMTALRTAVDGASLSQSDPAFPADGRIADDSDSAERRGTDATMHAAVYRSQDEEIDGTVRDIREAYLTGVIDSWNDAAVIVHDNNAVRSFGDALRREGVPVRYSSVMQTFAGNPTVEGLLALIDLAQMRNGTYSYATSPTASMDESAQQAAIIRRVVNTYLTSPLAGVKSDRTVGGIAIRRPLRLSAIRTALSAMTLGAVTPGTVTPGTDDASDDATAMTATDLLRALVLGDRDSARLMAGIKAIDPSDDIEEFDKALSHIDPVVEELRNPEHTVETVLWAAWAACDVADEWSGIALFDGEDANIANDRLDMATRLFRYAHENSAGASIAAFAARVRNMDVVADSLAQKAPVLDAVTVTTPAGAAGRSWGFVWIPSLQQGVWPNLEERNTMFGTEYLAHIMMRGTVRDAASAAAHGHNAAVASVLHSEEKSLLVSLTRATRRTTVSCSWNDSEIPSDFLFVFMPELFQRTGDLSQVPYESVSDAMPASVRGIVTRARVTLVGEACREMAPAPSAADESTAPSAASSTSGTLNMAAEMLFSHAGASNAKVAQTKESAQIKESAQTKDTRSAGTEGKAATETAAYHDLDATGRDAALTLAYLAHRGVDIADPDRWFFTPVSAVTPAGEETRAVANPLPKRHASSVSLNPSMVDAIWGCPICAVLDKSMSGPTPFSVSTSFGTLIHKVAQIASEKGWDNPENYRDLRQREDDEACIRDIQTKMYDVYCGLRQEPDASASPEDRYSYLLKDRNAQTALHNIASYFVKENDPENPYAADIGKSGSHVPFRVGEFDGVECEKSVSSSFTAADIADDFNKAMASTVDGASMTQMTGESMLRLFGLLVPGFPEGLDASTRIHLRARIDRLEHRKDDQGEFCRVIDYKTGKAHSFEASFNDLQLVCYQLALHYPVASSSERSRSVEVANASLFDVEASELPAMVGGKSSKSSKGGRSGKEEVRSQPALFENGKLTARFYQNRSNNTRGLSEFIQISLPDHADGVPDDVLAYLRENEYVTTTVWALTMIARVFYAAAVVNADLIPLRPPVEKQHFCRHKNVCPACAEAYDANIDTVMGGNE